LEHIGHIAVNLEPFVRHYGVFAVSLILALESLGAPLPGETLLKKTTGIRRSPLYPRKQTFAGMIDMSR
jgi:hypothetical protein